MVSKFGAKRDPNIPSDERHCPVHGFTEHRRYENSRNTSYQWRCMACSVESSRSYYARVGRGPGLTAPVTAQALAPVLCPGCYIALPPAAVTDPANPPLCEECS